MKPQPAVPLPPFDEHREPPPSLDTLLLMPMVPFRYTNFPPELLADILEWDAKAKTAK